MTNNKSRKIYAVYEDGTEVDLDAVIQGHQKHAVWEKTYKNELADYIEITGSGSGKILAYLIRNKDKHNRINVTMRELSKEINVSVGTIASVFKLLQEADKLRKIRNGSYMLNMFIAGSGMNVSQGIAKQMWKNLGALEGKLK